METAKIIDPRWLNCQDCPLHLTARSHVLWDASPGWEQAERLDALFVGEGPGRSEDLLGKPFVGRSGRLLRQALEDSGWTQGDLVWGMSNLVACRPCDGYLSGNRAPSVPEIQACKPRLASLVANTKPHWVVLLGRVPQAEASSFARWRIPTFGMTHPAALTRQGGVGSPAYRCMVTQLQHLATDCRLRKEVLACG